MDKRIIMRWWTVPRAEIPDDRDARIDWLFDWWERIDTLDRGEPARGAARPPRLSRSSVSAPSGRAQAGPRRPASVSWPVGASSISTTSAGWSGVVTSCGSSTRVGERPRRGRRRRRRPLTVGVGAVGRWRGRRGRHVGRLPVVARRVATAQLVDHGADRGQAADQEQLLQPARPPLDSSAEPSAPDAATFADRCRGRGPWSRPPPPRPAPCRPRASAAVASLASSSRGSRRLSLAEVIADSRVGSTALGQLGCLGDEGLVAIVWPCARLYAGANGRWDGTAWAPVGGSPYPTDAPC